MNSLSNKCLILNLVLFLFYLILDYFHLTGKSQLFFGGALMFIGLLSFVGIIIGLVEMKKKGAIAVVGIAGNFLIAVLFITAVLFAIKLYL